VRNLIADYLQLAKARLGALVVLTAFVGYLLGARGNPSLWIGAAAVVGTALSAFGANILNQWWEVERDRRMLRTRERPLPAGRIGRDRAGRWGIATALAGLVVLAAGTNWLTTGLSLGVILLYVLVYTPLKVLTPLNTVVGAVCGAVPPMMFSAASSSCGRFHTSSPLPGSTATTTPAAASECYRRSIRRAVSPVDWRWSTLQPCCRSRPRCPQPASPASPSCWRRRPLGWVFFRERSRQSARRLFLASILYLPVVLGLGVADMDHRRDVAAPGTGLAVASLASSAPAAATEF